MSDRLTDEELQEIRKRERTSLGGDWICVDTDSGCLMTRIDGSLIDPGAVYYFASHARNDIPRLLDEITRLRDQAQIDAGRIETMVEVVEGLRKKLRTCEEALRVETKYSNLKSEHIERLEPERDRLTDITRQMGRWLFSSQGANKIAGERSRQIDKEGYTPDFDDQHIRGELARAAACYALHAAGWDDTANQYWPMDWDDGSFKPGDTQSETLAKAGALIAAEIDRLRRKEMSECCGATVAVEGSWYVCRECGEAVIEETTND